MHAGPTPPHPDVGAEDTESLAREQPDRLEAIAAQQALDIRAVTLALEDEARQLAEEIEMLTGAPVPFSTDPGKDPLAVHPAGVGLVEGVEPHGKRRTTPPTTPQMRNSCPGRKVMGAKSG